MNVEVNITFKGGAGNVTITVFSNGNQVSQVVVLISGTVPLTNVSSGDIISIDGISPANGSDISISVSTDPPTPSHYESGPIMDSYIVL